MGAGAALQPGDEATLDPCPDPAKSWWLRVRWRALSGDRFGHAVRQGGDEPCGLVGRQPERPGAGIALPQRDHHGGVRLVSRHPHPAHRAPGVMKPGSLPVEVALLRHGGDYGTKGPIVQRGPGDRRPATR